MNSHVLLLCEKLRRVQGGLLRSIQTIIRRLGLRSVNVQKGCVEGTLRLFVQTPLMPLTVSTEQRVCQIIISDRSAGKGEKNWSLVTAIVLATSVRGTCTLVYSTTECRVLLYPEP